MEALTASSIPLRPSGLALLMAHKQQKRIREEAKQAYLGNVMYSILGSMHAMCKHDLQMPSYSEFVRMLEEKKKPALHQTPQETWQATSDMLHSFL